MKENNQELVKEIKNNKEEIVMNDNKEVKGTVAGGEKAPIIPEDMIGDFEEEIDQEEKERLEREFNKTLEPIGAEVREKIKEIKEEAKAYHKGRHTYFRSVKTYRRINDKTEEELKIQANNNWKKIQELLRDSNFSWLKGIRIKVDFCQVMNKSNNEIFMEGTTSEVFEQLDQLFYEILRDEQWVYPV